VVVQSAVLRPGETVAYGYWVLRLERAGPDLELWEHAADGSELQRGAELAMR
jgi:hypothetical protein